MPSIKERLQLIQEIKDPSLKMARILSDKSIAEAVTSMDKFQGVAGKDGYTPQKGKDYFTSQDIADMARLTQRLVKPAKDGEKGDKGDRGYTPIKNVDYFDGKDGYVPVKGKDYFDGKDGKDADESTIVDTVISTLKTKKFHEISDVSDLVGFLKRGGFRGGGGSSGNATSITGLIQPGTNVTITGTGTQSDPYVINSAGGSGGVTSFNTRTGDVTLTSGDVTTALGYTPGTGNGTVTNVSVASANGLAGTVATSTTTPAITLSTTVTGLLKGNGTAISAATAGTDFLASVNHDATLTGSGTTASALGINLANSNNWTAIQQITNTGNQLTLAYDATHRTVLMTDSNGTFNITPTNGAVTIVGGTTTSGIAVTSTSGNLFVPGTTTATSETASQYQYASSTTNFLRTAFYGSNGSNLAAGSNYSAVIATSAPVNTAFSGTHPWFSNFVINPLGTVTLNGAPVTNTATLYLGGASTVGTNNFTLNVASGAIGIAGSAGTSGQVLTSSGPGATPTWSTVGGSGTVTSFSSGNLSPLFTTSVATATSTPALSFSLTNAAANTIFGNNTGSSTAPAYGSASSYSDAILGLSSTGLLKRTGSNAYAIATGGTDYEFPLTFSAPLVRSTNAISITQATTSTNGYLSSSDWNTFNGKQSALTFSTGLTNTSGTITVNTSQNISTLSNLTTNGFVTTSGGTGALSVTVPASGVATFITTPTSANLATAVTDETGSGALVFATSPTLVTPNLGTPSTLVGTNITGTGASFTAGQATAALGLKTATTTLSVSSATAPTAGQVLTATSSTAATWQTPSAVPTTIISTLFETAGRFNIGLGSVTFNSDGLVMVGGASQQVKLTYPNLNSNFNEFDGNPVASWNLDVDGVPNSTGTLWFVIGPNITPITSTTTKHIGFKLDNNNSGNTATLYATQADGTTQSVSTALFTNITTSDYLTVYAQVTSSGVNYSARRNGGNPVTVTLTSNKPTGNNNGIMSISNEGGGTSYAVRFTSMSYSR